MYGKETHKINCLKTEKISSIKRKLKEKLGDENNNPLKLIFNEKIINDSDEIKKAEELGIENNSKIFFNCKNV